MDKYNKKNGPWTPRRVETTRTETPEVSWVDKHTLRNIEAQMIINNAVRHINIWSMPQESSKELESVLRRLDQLFCRLEHIGFETNEEFKMQVAIDCMSDAAYADFSQHGIVLYSDFKNHYTLRVSNPVQEVVSDNFTPYRISTEQETSNNSKRVESEAKIVRGKEDGPTAKEFSFSNTGAQTFTSLRESLEKIPRDKKESPPKKGTPASVSPPASPSATRTSSKQTDTQRMLVEELGQLLSGRGKAASRLDPSVPAVLYFENEWVNIVRGLDRDGNLNPAVSGIIVSVHKNETFTVMANNKVMVVSKDQIRKLK